MSATTEAIGNIVKHEFEHNGKVYQVSLITQEIKAKYEKAFFRRNRDCLLDMKEILTPEEYQTQVTKLQDDYMTGKFAFESEQGLDFMKQQAGASLIVQLLFNCTEEEVIKLLLERQEDVTNLITLIAKESFPKPPVKEDSKKKIKLKS